MTSFPGMLLTGLVVFVVWNAVGWARSRSADLPGSALLALILPALLGWYTLNEMGMWSHLPFPYALLAWAVLIPAFLITGAGLLLRRNFASGWPVLGVGVAGVASVPVALLVNRFTSGDPIL